MHLGSANVAGGFLLLAWSRRRSPPGNLESMQLGLAMLLGCSRAWFDVCHFRPVLKLIVGTPLAGDAVAFQSGLFGLRLDLFLIHLG